MALPSLPGADLPKMALEVLSGGGGGVAAGDRAAGILRKPDFLREQFEKNMADWSAG